MKFDITEMVKSKEAFRQRLAALPVAEKLRLLDALRERSLAIREAVARNRSSSVKNHRPTRRESAKPINKAV